MPAIRGIVFVALIGGATAFGQAINIDIGTATTTASGFGPPGASFGAAAGQMGVWNNLAGPTALSIPLVDLNGAATNAVLTRSTASGGNFNAQNANTSGDFEDLIDDGQDLSVGAGPETFTISGLLPGTYDVYVYAYAPDFAPDLTAINVNNIGALVIGGLPIVPPNTFLLGNTHGIFEVTLDGLTPTITITANGATVNDFGTFNGIQIVPEPAAISILALAAVALRRRR